MELIWGFEKVDTLWKEQQVTPIPAKSMSQRGSPSTPKGTFKLVAVIILAKIQRTKQVT